MKTPFTSRVISASALISINPVEVRALILCNTVSGAAVQLYDGKDSAAGEQRLHFEALANVSNSAQFPPGFLFERGLYVSLEANVEACTIVYRPLPFNRTDPPEE